MCTFCGRNHNSRPTTKIIRIYGKKDSYVGKDKYLGMESVPIDSSLKDWTRWLNKEYPEWDYIK